MKTTLLVGAGFSLEANRYLDPAGDPTAAPYPLVGDLAAACFSSTHDLKAGVEAAFQSATEKHDLGPVQRLVELLQSSDYYLGSKVAGAVHSAYFSLLDRFPDAVILSFNYDSLLEILLHRKGVWTPVDGFGVPCLADVDGSFTMAPTPPDRSSVVVIHLHGSISLYPLEFETFTEPGDETIWHRVREDLVCRFDPDALRDLFIPYRSGAGGLGYMLPDERIIAPVPDKAKALNERFIQESYQRALAELDTTDLLIAIGYRFAECDALSYDRLVRRLEQHAGRKLFIVSPEADAIAAQLRPVYPALKIVTFPGTFGAWASAGFPLP